MTTEANTFSAAVDLVVSRSKRPDRRNDIVSYIRQTLRECQVAKKVLFARDLTEDQIFSTGTPFIWTRPQEFRIMRAVRYQMYDNRGNYIFPQFVRPGKKQAEFDHFYYAGPDYFAFHGVSTGIAVDVAYYSYFKKLTYFDEASRPAIFDLETDAWIYLTAVTDAEKEAARNLVSNWMLFDWFDLVVEGALAKVFKTVGDQRAVSTFALYKSLQNDLLAGEEIESIGL